MARQNQTRKINALAALVMQMCEIVSKFAEAFATPDDPIHTALTNTRACALTLIDERAGFPITTDLEQSVTNNEVAQ